MTQGDGDGWAGCGRRHQHWGRHGAAGLLISAPSGAGGQLVLLVRRAGWARHGRTWSPPGGARHSHESAAQAAAREAGEECGPLPETPRVHGVLSDDHGGWSYQTLLATVASAFPVGAMSREIAEAAWVPAGEVGSLPLHPGFAAAWPVLQQALGPVSLIVDGANVMGSRPDGWWRDRAAAMERLYADLTRVAGAGVAALPPEAGGVALSRWFPRAVLVVEGKAKAAVGRLPHHDGIEVLPAPASGDETIAALAAALPGRRVVVTADQELRRRCRASGAAVTGPRWLTGLF